MNSALLLLAVLGCGGLIATTIYETWLGVSLREPSMTRIIFGASVSLKVLLLTTLGYILIAIHNPGALGVEVFGIERREYIRVLLYGGLAVQTTCVAVALYRWDRRAVRVRSGNAEADLILRQRELHERLDKNRLARESPAAARDRRDEERLGRAEAREIDRERNLH